MTNEDQSELIQMQQQLHDYLNAFVVAGMPENVVVTATLVAVTERVLRVSSPTQAAAWLRGQALAVEKYGPAMLAELRKR